jgi:hypothetical protein
MKSFLWAAKTDRILGSKATSIDVKVIISYPKFGYPTEFDSLAQIVPCDK